MTKADKELATDKALTAATLYLVCNDRPYDDIQDPRFRAMIQAAVDAAGIKAQHTNFSPTAAKDKCHDIAAMTRAELVDRLQGKKVTATFDHWTSRATLNYSCLTLHWIDDFKLQSSVISVYVYLGTSKAEAVYADFKRKLDELGLMPFVSHVVTDTAANMNKAGLLMEKDGRDHVYCTDHVLQLVAKKAFKATILGEAALRAAAERARAIKEQAEKEYKAAQEALQRSQQARATPAQRPARRAAQVEGQDEEEEDSDDEDDDAALGGETGQDAGLTREEREQIKIIEEALEQENTSPDAMQEEAEAMTTDPAEKKVKGVLRKARMIVAYFRRSTQAMGELRNLYHMQFLGPDNKKEKPDAPPAGKQGRLTKDFKLMQDVITRWWSTYNMIDRLLLLKPMIMTYAYRNGGFRKTKSTNKIEELAEDEWDALRDLRTLLKPFKLVMEKLQGNKYVTSSLVPTIIFGIHSSLDEAAKNERGKLNDSVAACARKMLKNFVHRYGNFKEDCFNREVLRGEYSRQVGVHRSLFVASALDPRTKELRSVPENQREGLWNYILDLMVEREYTRRLEADQKKEEESKKEQTQQSGTTAATAVDVGTPVKEGGEQDSAQQGSPDSASSVQKDLFEMGHPAEKEVPMSPAERDEMKAQVKEAMRLQLRAYRNAMGLKVEWKTVQEVDPLEWWKKNHGDFKNVWEVAEEFLAIPATAADSERAFSSAGNINTMKRTRLGSQLIDDGVLVKMNKEVVDAVLKHIYGDLWKETDGFE